MNETVEATAGMENNVALAERLRPLLGHLVLLLRRSTIGTPASTAQITALALLLDGPRRMHELSIDAAVTGPSMTVLVDRLEAQEWVQRLPDPADRRVVLVQLLPEGRRIVLETQAIRTALLADRLSRLSDADRATIVAALPALTALVDR
jgi:DNA-binding MarR family transcriptional regulator